MGLDNLASAKGAFAATAPEIFITMPDGINKSMEYISPESRQAIAQYMTMDRDMMTIDNRAVGFIYDPDSFRDQLEIAKEHGLPEKIYNEINTELARVTDPVAYEQEKTYGPGPNG